MAPTMRPRGLEIPAPSAVDCVPTSGGHGGQIGQDASPVGQNWRTISPFRDTLTATSGAEGRGLARESIDAAAAGPARVMHPTRAMLAEPQFPPTEPAHAVIRILLAEDDGPLRTVIARVLRTAGYEVVETADGHALLRHLASCSPLGPLPPPELVVSDVRMPGPDGLRVMQQAHSWGQSLPFVLMTAFGGDDFDIAATEYGASAVLHKPFALEELLTTVTSVLYAPSSPAPDDDVRRLC